MENLDIVKNAALAGGYAVRDYRPTDTEVKEDPDVGRHAIVTSADYKSQAAILKEIRGHYEAKTAPFFMTEEHVEDEWFRDRLIRENNLGEILSSEVYIIDELDGSSSKRIGHYEWSVSVGLIDKLEHTTAAVFAPDVFGGALFYASKENGSFMRGVGGRDERTKVSDIDLENSYLIVGVDSFLSKYPIHNKLLPVLGDRARTMNSNGSCALPLGLVAAGRADALIQPPNCPWDWAAGKLLVEEAGGVVMFYELKDGKIKFIEKLEARHYNPNKRTVGFIAANKGLAERIRDLFLKTS